MDAKTKRIAIIIGAGVAAYGVYYWYTNYGPGAPAAAAAAAAAAVAANTTSPGGVPTEPMTSAPGATLQALPTASTVVGPPAGISATEYQAVQAWATADGRPAVLAMAAAEIPAEYDGMYDIISNNAWANPSATQTQFWNTLRGKYGW